jgi:hypothetical protein
MTCGCQWDFFRELGGGVEGEKAEAALSFVALGKPQWTRGHLKVAATGREEQPATVGGPYKVREGF